MKWAYCIACGKIEYRASYTTYWIRYVAGEKVGYVCTPCHKKRPV